MSFNVVIDIDDEDKVNDFHSRNLRSLHGADLVVCDEGIVNHVSNI